MSAAAAESAATAGSAATGASGAAAEGFVGNAGSVLSTSTGATGVSASPPGNGNSKTGSAKTVSVAAVALELSEDGNRFTTETKHVDMVAMQKWLAKEDHGLHVWKVHEHKDRSVTALRIKILRSHGTWVAIREIEIETHLW